MYIFLGGGGQVCRTTLETVNKLSNSLFVSLVADGWCWFGLREKYCWLVADKPSEQGELAMIEDASCHGNSNFPCHEALAGELRGQ
jgi:hypothetical protein